MNFKLGFSPCPNDTFIFEKMIQENSSSLFFDYEMHDVEALNKKASEGYYDVCKLSYNAFASLQDDYQMLSAGSALGFGVGPLIISKQTYNPADLIGKTIAIPGDKTTAHLLLQFALDVPIKKVICLFSKIEEKVLSGEVDAGVIIHENRFTYASKGLHKVIDLGEYWEKKTGFPIPLGGIAVKRSLDETYKQTILHQLQESINNAFEREETITNFIAENAQEMAPSIMQKHIELYVNDFSVDLGELGKKAVEFFLKKSCEFYPENKFRNDWIYG